LGFFYSLSRFILKSSKTKLAGLHQYSTPKSDQSIVG
jgi:hypothetical protein